MQAAQMIQQIEAAVAGELQSHNLRAILAQVARINGRQPTQRELDEVVDFVIEYINHVPLLMLAMLGAAQKLGAQSQILPLLDACEQYWFEGMDLIPDHLGLLGLMDDGYYVLCIMRAIAERNRETNGRALMGLQLTPHNQIMRGLIGEPHATILDTTVATVLTAPTLNAILGGLQFFSSPLVDRDPIWGNASVDEIVTARLGALGVV